MSVPLGAIIITPYFGEWRDQRRVFHTARFTVAKVHIPAAFGTGPQHVRDLLRAGARTIVLRTDDDRNTASSVSHDLYSRGFAHLIEARPDIDWWIQVGNEPDAPGRDRVTRHMYRRELIEVVDGLKRHAALENVRWIAGIPISRAFYSTLMADNAIVSRYHALGCNIYGYWNIGDTGSEAQRNYEDALRTGHPVWITETGIDGALASDDKARRIVKFWQGISDDSKRQHQGMILFAIGEGTSWPTLEVDMTMAQVFTTRTGERCVSYPQTGYSVCGKFLDYHERYGGVRIFGYPITPEFIEDGRTVQYFERDRFEWHPENPPEWQVLQGLLGRQAYNARYGS